MSSLINLYAGPGAGKSMFAMELTAELKKRGVFKNFSCEYVGEVAKDYVWENSPIIDGAEKHQLILLGEQIHRIEKLNGNVDFIVTDSPILLNALYNKQCNAEFEKMVVRVGRTFKSKNFFLTRNPNIPYENKGRLQNFEEAILIDKKIKRLLKRNNIKYHETDYDIEEVIKKIIK